MKAYHWKGNNTAKRVVNRIGILKGKKKNVGTKWKQKKRKKEGKEEKNNKVKKSKNNVWEQAIEW